MKFPTSSVPERTELSKLHISEVVPCVIVPAEHIVHVRQVGAVFIRIQVFPSSFEQYASDELLDARKIQSNGVADFDVQYVAVVEVACVVVHVQHIAQVGEVERVAKQEQVHRAVRAVRP